ncbi:allergen Tha p 1 [Calliopsis andreniformis]|uniref:allergen Tha p 1 n=1 Tax=Calliopsis andreniformis TaxID=337506 RepID=UPI003FCDB1EA
MTLKIVLLFIVITLANFANAQGIMKFLNNKRFVEKQIDCILERGRCDVVGKRLIEFIPEILNDNCKYCSPQHKYYARTLLDFMSKNYPRELKLMIRRYKE